MCQGPLYSLQVPLFGQLEGTQRATETGFWGNKAFSIKVSFLWEISQLYNPPQLRRKTRIPWTRAKGFPLSFSLSSTIMSIQWYLQSLWHVESSVSTSNKGCLEHIMGHQQVSHQLRTCSTEGICLLCIFLASHTDLHTTHWNKSNSLIDHRNH